MENITVTIPAQIFDATKYRDSRGCYLADALHKAGYKSATVYGFGEIRLHGVKITHVAKRFNCERVRSAFDKGEDIIVELIPQ